MKASADDALLIDCGKKQYRLEYWTPWQNDPDSVTDRKVWVENLGSYGKDYYYFWNKVWFRKEKHLILYLLRWS